MPPAPSQRLSRTRRAPVRLQRPVQVVPARVPSRLPRRVPAPRRHPVPWLSPQLPSPPRQRRSWLLRRRPPPQPPHRKALPRRLRHVRVLRPRTPRLSALRLVRFPPTTPPRRVPALRPVRVHPLRVPGHPPRVRVLLPLVREPRVPLLPRVPELPRPVVASSVRPPADVRVPVVDSPVPPLVPAPRAVRRARATTRSHLRRAWAFVVPAPRAAPPQAAVPAPAGVREPAPAPALLPVVTVSGCPVRVVRPACLAPTRR